jgi:hypothetical protein
MKKILTIIAILLVAFGSNAATLTLNNATPSAGQYNTWTAALAAANNGDTILIHGTTNNYYSINVTKRLTIIGPGHHPTDKQNTQRAFCDNVLFYTGSNGSKVIGIETGNIQTQNADVDSVSILLCSIQDAVYFQNNDINFWLIEGCYFGNGNLCIRGQGHSVGDLVVRNNILNGAIYGFNYYIFIGYNYFNNNIFLSTTSVFQYNTQPMYINSNIFYRAGYEYGCSGMTYNKNCSYQSVSGNTFPNGVNFGGVDPQFVTSIGTGAYFDYATDYHLQATSPLINAGGDGTDLGVYGGYGDYEQNGVPHNPYIKTFNITGSTSVNAGSPIQIYIKAKVRN